LQLDGVEKAKAKERQTAGLKKGDTPVVLKKDQREEKGRRNAKLGQIAGVGHEAIHKARVIKQEGSDDLISKVRRGEVSLDKGFKEVRPTGRAPGKPPRKGSKARGKMDAATTITAAKIPAAVKASSNTGELHATLKKIVEHADKLVELTKDATRIWSHLSVQREAKALCEITDTIRRLSTKDRIGVNIFPE